MTSSATLRTPASPERPQAKIAWPKKYDLFGVSVAASNYDEIADVVAQSAIEHVPAVISLHAVHAIIESLTDPKLLAKVNCFDSVLPDG